MLPFRRTQQQRLVLTCSACPPRSSTITPSSSIDSDCGRPSSGHHAASISSNAPRLTRPAKPRSIQCPTRAAIKAPTTPARPSPPMAAVDHCNGGADNGSGTAAQNTLRPANSSNASGPRFRAARGPGAACPASNPAVRASAVVPPASAPPAGAATARPGSRHQRCRQQIDCPPADGGRPCPITRASNRPMNTPPCTTLIGARAARAAQAWRYRRSSPE